MSGKYYGNNHSNILIKTQGKYTLYLQIQKNKCHIKMTLPICCILCQSLGGKLLLASCKGKPFSIIFTYLQLEAKKNLQRMLGIPSRAWCTLLPFAKCNHTPDLLPFSVIFFQLYIFIESFSQLQTGTKKAFL